MFTDKITNEDTQLIQAALKVITRNYISGKHSVGAAVLCSSGKVYTGINIEACAYGPCAEPIAIGNAFSNGERELVAIVAVHKEENGWQVISPCGNCRQLLVDYAPEALVIFQENGRTVKGRAQDLLPGAYLSCFQVNQVRYDR